MKFIKQAATTATAAIALCAAMAGNALAAYPDHPIRMVLPYVAGGNTDVLARLLAERMGRSLKQSIVVDNKPGAGGSIATAEVARSKPDGYTILLGTSSTQAINPAVYPKLPYDAVKDFSPIGMVALSEYALAVPASSPYRTIEDLLRRGKQQPLRYASNGNGTTSHLASALLTMKAGLNATHIPYKGSTPAMTDLMGGQVDFLIDNTSTVLTQLPSGKIRLLATTGSKRADVTKNVPTLREAGLKDYEIIGWWVLEAPAGTPASIIDTLHKELALAMEDPEMRKRLDQLGMPPYVLTPEKTTEFIKADLAKFKGIAKAINLSLD